MDLPSGSSVSIERSVIVAYESLSCPRCEKDGSQNHTVIVGKSSNTHKCWKTKEFVGAEGFF